MFFQGRLSGMIEQLRGGPATLPAASGRSPRQPFFSRLRAKYDAANTTLDNYRHWSRADGLSAASANSPDVRRTLRNRSRYEVANNSYARGITLTLANDVVGTGPRLQMVTVDDAANHFVEAEFLAWCDAKVDIEAWWPKIRRGGLLIGHDYNPDRFPGVCRAVDEFNKAGHSQVAHFGHSVWAICSKASSSA